MYDKDLFIKKKAPLESRAFSFAKLTLTLRQRYRSKYLREPLFDALPEALRQFWWVVQGLNLRPLPCEGSALPLS